MMQTGVQRTAFSSSSFPTMPDALAVLRLKMREKGGKRRKRDLVVAVETLESREVRHINAPGRRRKKLSSPLLCSALLCSDILCFLPSFLPHIPSTAQLLLYCARTPANRHSSCWPMSIVLLLIAPGPTPGCCRCQCRCR